jgi:hypothetical protein
MALELDFNGEQACGWDRESDRRAFIGGVTQRTIDLLHDGKVIDVR